MLNLLAFHRLAMKGDGLADPILQLLAERSRIAADPNIVELHRVASRPRVAGPPPGGAAGARSTRLRRES